MTSLTARPTHSSRGDSLLALVEGHLDRAAFALVGDRQEGVPPLVEPEGVSQHGTQINSAVDNQIEVVLDRVLALPVDLLDPECVAAHPADLLEVQRTPLPPAWRMHPGLHQR